MTSFYEDIRDGTVKSLLSRFGYSVTLKRHAGRVYSATTGKFSQDPDTDPVEAPTIGLKIGAVAVLKGTGEYRQDMVLAWNEGFLLSAAELASLPFVPTPNDLLVVNGKECPIIKVVAIAPGDVAVAYKVGVVLK